MLTFIEHGLTFGQSLKTKVNFDTEAKQRKQKYRAVITRSAWIEEDASYARVLINPNGDVTVSRVRKKRGKNYLTVEDYAANDWQVRF